MAARILRPPRAGRVTRGLGGRACGPTAVARPQLGAQAPACVRFAAAARAGRQFGPCELGRGELGGYRTAARGQGDYAAVMETWSAEDPDCMTVSSAVETKPPFEGSMLSSQPSGGSPPPNDYYAQTGLAIRTLRDEVPHIFERDISYDIFTDDVGFIDTITARSPEKPHIIMGKEKYKGMYKTLRWHGKLFFTKLKVDVLRIWQPKDKVIAVRWTVTAVPRLLNGIIDSTFYLDGISEYKLNDEGFIYQHKVDNVDMNTGQQAMQWSSLRALLQMASPTPPVPTACVGRDPQTPFQPSLWVGEPLTHEEP